MVDFKQIGIIHSLTQLIALGIFSGGAIFLLPLALAEITGWVILGLWMGLNFVGLPVIVNFVDKTFNPHENKTTLKIGLSILLIGLIGGMGSFILELIYYKFHMFYIEKDFIISDYKDDFLSFVTTMTVTIIVGEIIRRKRKANSVKSRLLQ